MDLLRLLRSDEVPSDKNVIWVDTSNNLSPVLKVFIPNRGWVLLDEAYSGDVSKEQIINTIREVLKDDNIADKDDITTAISSINIPDISGLATKNELKIVEGKIITSYKDLTDKPYIPSADNFATRNWVEDRPVSTFTNDSGYVTENSVDTKLSNYVLKKDGYSLVSNSDIEQISKNKSTLNIYGGDVNVVGSIAWQIKEKFKEFNSLQKEIVAQVPQPQDAEPNVLYLLKIGTNKYQQWTLIGSEMLNVGDTDVDLTKYVKKEDLCWNIDENEKDEVTTTNAVVSYVKKYVKDNTINPIVDESPTYLSTNLVTSGGVYDAIKETVSDKYIAKTEDLDIFSDEDKIVLYIGETNEKYIHNEYYERIDGSWVISPRKVSTLENDTQYQTKQDVDTELLKYVLKEENKSLVSNTDIEQITLNKNAISVLNGEENIDGSVKNTILEYIGNSTHLSKEIVSVLPSIDDAADNTIYLIPFENKQGVYKQYIKIGNEFVQLDNTDIDLSSYYNTDKLEIHSSIDDTKDTANKKYVPNVSAVKSAIDNIDYLKEISKGTDGRYVTTTISAKNNKTQTIGTSVKVQAISSANEANNGLVEAKDVKEYVTNQINAIPKEKCLPLVDDLDNYDCPVGTIVKYNGADGKYVNGWDYKKGTIRTEQITEKGDYFIIPTNNCGVQEGAYKIQDTSNRLLFTIVEGRGDYVGKFYFISVSNSSANIDAKNVLLFNNNIYIDASTDKLPDGTKLQYGVNKTVKTITSPISECINSNGEKIYSCQVVYPSINIIFKNYEIEYPNFGIHKYAELFYSKIQKLDIGEVVINGWVQHNAQPDISGQVTNIEGRVAINEQNILSLQSTKADASTWSANLKTQIDTDHTTLSGLSSKWTDILYSQIDADHKTLGTLNTYLSADKQGKIDDAIAKAHTQNTDTQLASGVVKVQATEVYFSRKLYSINDVWGNSGADKLSEKLNSNMQQAFDNIEDLLANINKIPNGAWCAIIDTHSGGVSAQSDDDYLL